MFDRVKNNLFEVQKNAHVFSCINFKILVRGAVDSQIQTRQEYLKTTIFLYANKK